MEERVSAELTGRGRSVTSGSGRGPVAWEALAWPQRRLLHHEQAQGAAGEPQRGHHGLLERWVPPQRGSGAPEAVGLPAGAQGLGQGNALDLESLSSPWHVSCPRAKSWETYISSCLFVSPSFNSSDFP